MSYRRLKYVINYLITLPSALPWRVIDVLVVSRSNKFGASLAFTLLCKNRCDIHSDSNGSTYHGRVFVF